jgi:deoxyribonuclease V
MILATDTYYTSDEARVIGALFDWSDYTPKEIFSTRINNVEPYESGKFYKRELPCIIKLIENIDLEKIEFIIVDGHCYVNDNLEYGLGGYLYNTLEQKIPVIGVAKNSLAGLEKLSIPILRGKSKNPLYISSIGCDLNYAAEKIKTMSGEFRIPTILKIVDQKTREEN